MYAMGEGMPQDYAESKKWWRQAAEQGYAEAQYSLGVMYANGEGVPEDDVAAYAWFSVAAASGHDNGRGARDMMKDQLTPSQLDRGQVMAREIFERIERNKKRKAAKAE
jgi:TPR repeat protein